MIHFYDKCTTSKNMYTGIAYMWRFIPAVILWAAWRFFIEFEKEKKHRKGILGEIQMTILMVFFFFAQEISGSRWKRENWVIVI